MNNRDDALADAYAMRRRILGDEYVEARANPSNPSTTAFQDFITSQAWTVWTREAFSPRDRSLLVLAMTAALGRQEEFELHIRSAPRAEVRDDEVDELLYQIAAYCGAPAAVSARRIVERVRKERSEST